ncbi:MBL fold metallo-hydrolase [Cupriavidus sp. UYPR2.512]|uniref:MBL fold metallo-hydrolase n=1 Tax=Cupriavidus sp. UYPR2.512 TaxID=1080187 RepID=UPI0012F8BBBF|nr:MBL fold metallo-hydrolase [Cupriavidus necator]
MRNFAKTEKREAHTNASSAIRSEGASLKGVFMTHLHLDHISGMPDIPKDVQFYPRPG